MYLHTSQNCIHVSTRTTSLIPRAHSIRSTYLIDLFYINILFDCHVITLVISTCLIRLPLISFAHVIIDCGAIAHVNCTCYFSLPRHYAIHVYYIRSSRVIHTCSVRSLYVKRIYVVFDFRMSFEHVVSSHRMSFEHVIFIVAHHV